MFNTRIAAGITALAVAACVNDVPPRANFETLAAQTPWKVENGRETRDFALGGVVVSQERVGNEVRTLTIDQSGHGAVMCARMIYDLVLLWVELCQPEDKEWRDNLSTALGRINDFIVVNSLTPVTKQEVEAQMTKERSQALRGQDTTSAQTMEKLCRSKSDLGIMSHNLKKVGYGPFQDSVERLLSVPRPPVLNPCL